MADIYLAEQTKPTTPSSGNGIIWPCSTASLPFYTDDAGRIWGRSHNAATAAQTGFAADTYLTDSDILIPSFGVQAKTCFIWRVSGSKTAAGVAAPIYTIRIGSARTTSDTLRVQMTGAAQTAATDTGLLTVMATVRNVGASGIIRAIATWSHSGASTGFANDLAGATEGISAAFDNSALGGNYVGLSINGGASASWNITQVIAEALW